MTIRKNDPTVRTGPIQRGTRRLATAMESLRQGTAKLMMPADRLSLSTAEKLVEGNRRAVGHAAKTLTNTVIHPLDAFKGMGGAIVNMFLHPWKSLDEAAQRFDKEPIEGTVMAANLAASWMGLSALLCVGGAYLAAPFTGGASLGLLPIAASLGGAAGLVGTAALGLSFAKNQIDIAGAETEEELEQESKQLGDDVANYGFSAILAKGAEGISSFKGKNVDLPDAPSRPQFDLPDAPPKRMPAVETPEVKIPAGDPIPDALSTNYELVHDEEEA